ncbi:GIY-YIG nuclease family protein [Bradyrhizobium sp. ISRA464]|nr:MULTISPECIES: GIY-YIG nuclease family protein [unclassified Bradyrhizobium]WGS23830.1 GIY-YIG nuclease family protein [Bradyrhizobium sp. ISRA463]WGS31142.1 GIY-YIG nuclease family protein [Bradyrhizobium sp. ISRA464]
MYQHRTKAVPGFTSRYNITRLVWFEICDDPISAISREKELGKRRWSWKTQLIEATNPQWNDLYESICIQGRHSGASRSDEPGIS